MNEFELLKSRVDDKVRKTHIETPSKWRIVNVSQDNVSDDLGNIQFKHIESNVQGTIALIFFLSRTYLMSKTFGTSMALGKIVRSNGMIYGTIIDIYKRFLLFMVAHMKCRSNQIDVAAREK